MKAFLKLIKLLQGTCYLVGGAVIDKISHRKVKDWDIEVHGITMKDLITCLKCFNLPINEVGKSFGVIKTIIDDIDIDLSLPRRDNKTDTGHKGFTISVDTNMSVREAGLRRDLTINSMYLDMHTNNIVDPFGGLDDFKHGVLRVVDPITFREDPLRVMRIMQLLPRKGRVVDPNTIEICKGMIDNFPELPKERVFEEFKKLLLLSNKPSMGFEFLRDCGWIKYFPELQDLIGCKQSPIHHPEGCVWTHTMLVIDNAAKLRHNIKKELRLTYMLSALCHDLGKPGTTLEDFTAHGHDIYGVDITINFLKRLTNEVNLIKLVTNLVEFHMRPNQLVSSNAGQSAWKRLHNKSNLMLLGYLTMADSIGRTGRSIEDENIASELCFSYNEDLPTIIKPIVTGKDLIDLGYSPGPIFKTLLEKAYELQLEGEINKKLILKQIK